MKIFSFRVFYYKTELFKQLGQYIVATGKVTVQDVNRLVLWDKKTIVNKRNNGNQNF